MYDDGATVGQKVSNVDSWEKCSALCEAETLCKAWTWVSSSYNSTASDRETCVFKSENPVPAVAQGTFSGHKSCSSKQGNFS